MLALFLILTLVLVWTVLGVATIPYLAASTWAQVLQGTGHGQTPSHRLAARRAARACFGYLDVVVQAELWPLNCALKAVWPTSAPVADLAADLAPVITVWQYTVTDVREAWNA